jgi:hypothetical protein
MKKIWWLTGIIVIAHVCYGADFSASALTGFKGGLGFKVSGTVSHFAQGFPLAFEFGIGYTQLDPGNPELARRIFINEATNGTPEKNGYMWDLRFDFLYPLRILGMQDAALFAGVRRSFFTATFRFVGGNELFDVLSDQWGWGAGVKASFPMGKNVSFSMSAGFDHYPNAALSGHDTTYSPDGETVNGKEKFTYSDADNAINQPKFQPVLMVGLTLLF